MPTMLICPICGVAGSVRFKGNAIEIDYDFDQWGRKCAHPGAPSMTSCPGMRTIMQLIVSQVRQPDDDAKD